MTPGTASTVDVHAVITAKAMTDSGARELLAQGSIQEVVEPARVHIETRAPRGVPGSYVVSYQVRVPPGVQASVSNSNGSVSVRGLSGKVKLSDVNGKTEIADIAAPIDAVVANGTLTADAAIVRVDTVRSLEALAHHAWRSSAHLVGRGE